MALVFGRPATLHGTHVLAQIVDAVRIMDAPLPGLFDHLVEGSRAVLRHLSDAVAVVENLECHCKPIGSMAQPHQE